MTNDQMIVTLLTQLKEPMDVFLRLEKLNLLRDVCYRSKKTQLLKEACAAIIELVNMNLQKLDVSQQMKAHDMLKDAHTQYGRYNFESFLIAMEWNRPVEKRFYQPRMKVLSQVVRDLQDLGDGKIDVYILSMPPRVGKLLSDDTPVLTTKGWKNHGDLKVGDYVYSPLGFPVKVTHVFPKNVANLEVTFSNGEKIKCHENHEWYMFDKHRNEYRVLETKEMIGKLEEGTPGKRGHRYFYRLPPRMPIFGEKHELRVDPYVLGVWLGDGRARYGDICYNPKDKIVFETIVEKGYIISWTTTHKDTGVKYAGFKDLRQQLQSYDMCYSKKTKPKYIPEDYLTADVEDRLELLAGLLDTDGCLIKKEKRYQFTTSCERLKDTFIQLVSTFGWRCSVQIKEPKLSSSGIQGRKHYWVIAFNPTLYIPCRIERKQLKEFSKKRRITVTKIEKIEPEQGNCISVDGGLYCVGKTMLPTHNSTIGLFFIAWMAGRYPDEHIFGAGYVSGLVKTFYNGVLDFIDSAEYRFYEIFPELDGKTSKSAEDRTIDLWEDDRYKTVTFRSVDGQITGALEASSLLYMDDMCSGIEEAMNLDRLDKLWSKVSVDLMQRRVQNKRTGRLAPMLAIGTIWSLHDPISRLKREYLDSPLYRERVMPALDENDESNFNYDYGVGFTTEMYRSLRSGMDRVSWECVYQQNPIERDGLMFPELKRYLQLPAGQPDAVVAFCDVAFGSDDYLSFPVGYIWGTDGYVVDVVFRKRADYKITEPMVAAKIIQHEVQMAEFEANNGGDFYARDVDRMVKESSSHRCNITWKLAGNRASKLARIIQMAPDIRNWYYQDPSMYKPNSEYGLFIKNMLTFVETGGSLNDDGPDSMAGLCKMMISPRVGTVTSRRGIRGAF